MELICVTCEILWTFPGNYLAMLLTSEPYTRSIATAEIARDV